MSEFTPPAAESRVVGGGISVRYFATLFEGDATADNAFGIAPVALEPAVTGWMHPNHRLISQAGTERLEDGSTITDHVVAMPARLTLQGHVSDITSPNGSAAPGQVWALLRSLHKAETLLSVITEWSIYENMIIRSIDTTQEHRGMVFSMELQEIVRVGVSYYDAKVRVKTGKGRGSNVDGGNRPVFSSIPASEGETPVLFDGRTNTPLEGSVYARGRGGSLYVTLIEDAVFDTDGSISGVPGSVLTKDYAEGGDFEGG